MSIKIIGVSFQGWSRTLSLAEVEAKLGITPKPSGSHTIGDRYRRRGEEHSFDYTLFRVDSGEPDSSPLDLHLASLAERMK